MVKMTAEIIPMKPTALEREFLSNFPNFHRHEIRKKFLHVVFSFFQCQIAWVASIIAQKR